MHTSIDGVYLAQHSKSVKAPPLLANISAHISYYHAWQTDSSEASASNWSKEEFQVDEAKTEPFCSAERLKNANALDLGDQWCCWSSVLFRVCMAPFIAHMTSHT
jgi:hypothetical protein